MIEKNLVTEVSAKEPPSDGRRRPKAAAAILKLLLGFWMAGVILAAFLWAPPAQGLGPVTYILYFHVPCAELSFVAFFVCGVYAILYLRRQQMRFDAVSAASAELGLVFCALATVTGSLWSRATWGAYWNWDPRQTYIFVLLLLYGAYLTLRGAVEDPRSRASLSGVYAVFALVCLPFLVYILPQHASDAGRSLHPVMLRNKLVRGESDAMDTRMLVVLLASMAGFGALYYWMLNLRLAIERLSGAAEPEL